MGHWECAHPPTRAARNDCRWESGGQSGERGGKYGRFADAEIHELSAEEIWEIRRGDLPDLKRSLNSYAKHHGLTLSMVKTPDKGLRFRMWHPEEVEDEGEEVSDYLLPELVEREKRQRDRRNRRLPPNRSCRLYPPQHPP